MYTNKHWFKKYQPKELNDLDHTVQVSDLLRGLAKKTNFPVALFIIQHILIYGPSGSGKYTRAMCFLNELFGEQIHQIQYSQEQIYDQNQQDKMEQAMYYSLGRSKYHMEIDVANLHNKDKLIIQTLLKSKQIQQSTAKFTKVPRVFILRTCSKLSRQAQAALRATMQKQSSSIRLIFICQNIHEIISPIKSRCLNIRLKAPSPNQIYDILQNIKKINRCKTSDTVLKQIVQKSEGNIRKAINFFQCYQNMFQSTRSPVLPFETSQNQLNLIIKMMFDEQSVQQSKNILQKLSVGELIKKNIREIPMMFITKLINKGISESLLKEIIRISAKYQIYFDPSVKEYQRLAPIMTLIETIMLEIKDEKDKERQKQKNK